jgi:hypothetical protein
VPAEDTVTYMPSRSAILYRVVRGLRLRSANSVSVVCRSRGWDGFYRHQPRDLRMPANPHEALLYRLIFTVTPGIALTVKTDA